MTVAELIKALSVMSPSAEVHFEHGAGDYWRTTVAPRVCEVTIGVVEYSDYHRMDKVVDNYDSKEGREVVLIG